MNMNPFYLFRAITETHKNEQLAAKLKSEYPFETIDYVRYLVNTQKYGQ